MLPEDDRVRLHHMLEAAETAIDFAAGRSQADLETDTMLRFALVRAIEIIGEAASRVSAAGQQAAPEVPWRQIVGMRNRLIHAYFDIDREVLWKTVSEEIPGLLPHLRTLSEAEP